MHDKSTQDVYDACTVLFHDHPDLLQEFNHFSTDGSAAAPTVTVPRGVSVKEDSRNAQGAGNIGLILHLLISKCSNNSLLIVNRISSSPSTCDTLFGLSLSCISFSIIQLYTHYKVNIHIKNYRWRFF